jgi:hypothetical protein
MSDELLRNAVCFGRFCLFPAGRQLHLSRVWPGTCEQAVDTIAEASGYQDRARCVITMLGSSRQVKSGST